MSELTVGTTLGSFGAGFLDGPVLCEWAQRIEQIGFDTLWYRDHLLWHSPVLEPFTMLGALAASTHRIQLGTGVLLLPLRHPVHVAKAVSTLDRIAGGRTILGVGLGGEFSPEFTAVNVPTKERGERANESLAALKTLWGESPSTFNGRFFSFIDVTMEPRPVQLPHPPIWVGGRSDAALRRAGRFGDAWFGYFEDPEGYARKLSVARSHVVEPGSGSDFGAGLVLYFCIDRTAAAARAQAIAYLSAEYQQPFDRIADRYCALGTAQQCAGKIQEFIDAGVQHFNVVPACAPSAAMAQLEEIHSILKH